MLDRRRFIEGVGWMIVAASQVDDLSGQTPGKSPSGRPDALPAYLRVTDSSLLLGNDQVELKIDSHTGFFEDIMNKQTGMHHKLEGTGTWPLGLRLGDA